MEDKAPAVRTYNPIPYAVLPGTTARGLILGLVYMPVASLVFVVSQEVAEGTPLGPPLEDLKTSLGLGGIAGLGFLFAATLSLFLAWLGYRRQSYEIDTDGITERRGILFRSENHLDYGEFEGVTVTESFVQSLYGAGTVLLTDINQKEDEQVTMKMSYVRNPEDVSTTILRQVTDLSDAETGDLDAHSVEGLDVESASISRLSSDALAAGTGFEYLMPSAILHPRPEEAAKYGFERGLTLSAIGGAFVLYYLRDWLVDLLGLPSGAHLFGITGLSAVVFSLLMAGIYYVAHDHLQYELYDDHINFVDDDTTTSYSLSDVEELVVDSPGLTDLSRPWSDVAHIALLDENRDEVIVFKYIANSQAVSEEFEDWLKTAETDQ